MIFCVRKHVLYLVYVVLLGLGWPVNHVLLEYDGMFKRFDEGQWVNKKKTKYRLDMVWDRSFVECTRQPKNFQLSARLRVIFV